MGNIGKLQNKHGCEGRCKVGMGTKNLPIKVRHGDK